MRLEIEQRLGSSLSRTDIGKHTAYIVLRNGVPMGFVHARTETGSRGSVELVWALDLDLTIKDSRVQRSREPHSVIIESASFREKMVGRDLVGHDGRPETWWAVSAGGVIEQAWVVSAANGIGPAPGP